MTLQVPILFFEFLLSWSKGDNWGGGESSQPLTHKWHLSPNPIYVYLVLLNPS